MRNTVTVEVTLRARGFSREEVQLVLRREGSVVASTTVKLEPGKEREAYFMGLGDAVMPTILAVSANAFLKAPVIGFANVPAWGTIIGTSRIGSRSRVSQSATIMTRLGAVLMKKIVCQP